MSQARTRLSKEEAFKHIPLNSELHIPLREGKFYFLLKCSVLKVIFSYACVNAINACSAIFVIFGLIFNRYFVACRSHSSPIDVLNAYKISLKRILSQILKKAFLRMDKLLSRIVHILALLFAK